MPLYLAHLVHMTNQSPDSLLLLHDWCFLSASVAWELWHGFSEFSLLHATCLKSCLCSSWIWKASPSSLRGIPFSLAITIYSRTVIFEVVLVVISRQHLGRCAWYGSTRQLRPAGQLLVCWASQLDPGHGSTASAAQRGRSKVTGQSWGFWSVLGAATLRAMQMSGFKNAGQQCERVQYIGLACCGPTMSLEITGKLTAYLCCL